MTNRNLNPANLNHPPAPQAAAIRAGSAFKTSASFKEFSKDKMTMLCVSFSKRIVSVQGSGLLISKFSPAEPLTTA